MQLVWIGGLKLIQGDQQPAIGMFDQLGQSVQHPAQRKGLVVVSVDELTAGRESRGPRTSQPVSLGLRVELTQVIDHLGAQLVDQRRGSGMQGDHCPADLGGHGFKLRQQHRLASAAGTGHQHVTLARQSPCQGTLEVLDRGGPSGQDRRAQPKTRREWILIGFCHGTHHSLLVIVIVRTNVSICYQGHRPGHPQRRRPQRLTTQTTGIQKTDRRDRTNCCNDRQNPPNPYRQS